MRQSKTLITSIILFLSQLNLAAEVEPVPENENSTIGYGDVTPSTSLGKILAIAFGIVGIVCVALLTANILEANSKFNELESDAKV